MSTWTDAPEPEHPPISAMGWMRIGARGVPLAVLVISGFCVLMLLRLIERPIFGMQRPWTPSITQVVCRTSLRLLGLRYRAEGTPMRQKGAMVANHGSWLDIFSLNAKSRVYFVSKSDVAAWPGIGTLARGVGTVFIERNPRAAKAQRDLFESRLRDGHRLVFFPEGTSSDGLRVLPFKSTLFAAFFIPKLRGILYIQPVTVSYRAPDGAEAQFYGWWGDMDFAPHLLQVLASAKQGGVTVKYHEPLKVSEFADRKALAQTCETAVRAGLTLSSAEL